MKWCHCLKYWTPQTVNVKRVGVDVDERIDADKGIVLSHTIADENLINAVMNPNSEKRKEIITEENSWTKAANILYSSEVCQMLDMLLSMGKMQLHI